MQEKARECRTKDELNEFIADNDLELPEDALELVAGGCGTSTPPPVPDKCNKCNAKVTQCTTNDVVDITLYNSKRWGLQQGYYSISSYYCCPNFGIVYEDEIHA